MCSKYLQGVAFNSEESRPSLLRSISNQISTLYSYNIYFTALSLVLFCISLPNKNYMTFMLNIIIFSISSTDCVKGKEKKQKEFTFKINCTGGFHFNSP